MSDMTSDYPSTQTLINEWCERMEMTPQVARARKRMENGECCYRCHKPFTQLEIDLKIFAVTPSQELISHVECNPEWSRSIYMDLSGS